MSAAVVSVLRSREPLEEACRAVGVSVEEFRRERDAYLRSKLPPAEERLRAAVAAPVEVVRDRLGIPHVWAGSERDALVALGYCMGRDRLWQLDYLRREALGTLAELLGPNAHLGDLRMRTIGIPAIAAAEVELIDEATRELVDGFVVGINLAMEAARPSLPLEFDLLGYEPTPWTLRDTIAVLRGLWWQLNGRLEQIVAAEAAALHLDEVTYAAFMTPEMPDERILHADAPRPIAGSTPTPPNAQLGVGDATGSNNWAIAASRTTTGRALLASDPHLPFEHPTDLYEAHLAWPGHDVVGSLWVGAPGATWGYNRHIAWGVTNNATSQRDLYVEEVRDGAYRRGDRWVPFATRDVEIRVRGEAPRRHTIRRTDLGPVINDVTPSVAQGGDPPLSLRWVGAEHLDDLKASLAIQRAYDFASFRTALADWAMPSWNWICATADGEVGYQHAGRIPLRGRVVRGYRQANEPLDQWRGYLPFEVLPRMERPARGYVATANNRVAPDDYPYPLHGAFAGGNRALRIRQRLESVERVSPAYSRDLQNDVYLIRAARMVPAMVRALRDDELAAILDGWDFRYTLDSPAPTIFEAINHRLVETIAAREFPRHLVPLARTVAQAAVARMVEAGELDAEVRAAALDAHEWLRRTLGADPAGWAWGRCHTMTFVHPLAASFGPAFAEIANVGPRAIPGSADSVRNAAGAFDRGFQVVSGAEYRFLVDFAADVPAVATNTLGQSGQPGSPHFADQLEDWVVGRYHPLVMERDAVEREPTTRVRIEPA